MAKNHLNKIFLSAGIPDQQKGNKYIESADIIAIRDAIRALATVVIPNSILVWGGHPAITPLIRYVMAKMNSQVKDHVTLFQSNYFSKYFPKENQYFENIVLVPENEDRDISLHDMRLQMISLNKFKAGIFIGGMEGVEIEFQMFKERHPKALLLPIASTGAAAKYIYDEMPSKYDPRLLSDRAYMNLFTTMLKKYI